MVNGLRHMGPRVLIVGPLGNQSFLLSDWSSAFVLATISAIHEGYTLLMGA